jgi:hypothetical protein
MHGGNTLVRLVATVALAIVTSVPFAHAGDRVSELTAMLSSSSSKTRMQAVLSLSRLGDSSAMKPLVGALSDPNETIRAVAAKALGKLGHKSSLPALKNAAKDDVDSTVREAAREAAIAVAKANNIKDDAVATKTQARAKTSGFGRTPHAVEDHPDLFVTIKGADDSSPGKADKVTRKINSDIIKAALEVELKSAAQVTMVASEGQRWGLDPRMIDVSVTKLEVVQVGGYVEVVTELRLSISDDKGKMLSFLSGGAKVQVPAGKFNAKYLPNLRKEALEGAMRGMFDKLLVHLRQITTT